MLIRIGKASHLKENAVTPRTLFEGRRRFIAAAAAGGIGAIAGSILPLGRAFAAEREKIPGVQDSPYTLGSLGEDVELTGYDAVTHYNNFYEFGTGKSDPSTYATDFQTRPWTVEVGGECMKPGTFDVDVLMKRHALEERIYRLRCVEAWSMVVPWVGFPLAALLKQVEPTSRARFVAFETLYDPDQMPGQKRSVLPWPYVEGLRMDEAMNDLTLLSVGLYGEVLPNQNGAPIRLVVPWKYGFKSIKSIVKITLVENQPPCTWNEVAPREYGFYSNVNPNVPHPRWSQAKERVIGEGLFAPKRDTEMFNGYGEQVAALYEGMDLEKYY